MGELLGLLQFGSKGWGDELLAGTLVTIALSLATVPVGLVVGFVVALGKQSRDPLVRVAAQIYTTIFRGLPELLTLFLVYYGAQLGVTALFSLVGSNFQISPFLAGMVALGLVLSAYASEVFLSAFRAIPIGQYEAAAALGLHRVRTLRLVIFPQLIRLALPALSNLWLNVMKDTALVSVITLNDLLRQTSIAVGTTKEPFFFYTVALLIYLVLSVLASIGIWRIDVWASRGMVRR
ncbi:MAG TPA: ABC transporter permease subunit [Bauldia sp.]|nr:ABC transporter permease subunit [Bauldia sp.]